MLETIKSKMNEEFSWK